MRLGLLIAVLFASAVAEDDGRAGQAMRALGPDVFIGLRALENGRPDQALSAFKVLLDEHPDSARLQLFVGQAHLEMNDCDEGERWVVPNQTRPAFQVGYSEMLAGCHARRLDYSSAEYWQEVAVALNPTDPVQICRLALYRYRMGDERAAQELLDEAAELKPNHTAVWHTRGLIALTEGRHDEVEEIIEKLHGLPRGPHQALVLEARLELDLGNAIAAGELAHQANRKDMNSSAALVLRGEAERRIGDPIQAITLLSRRAKVYDERPRMWASLIRAHADLGDVAEAASILDEALALDATDPEIIASAWYLARARGDTIEMTRLSARYDLLQTNPYRRLDMLVPYTESP